MTDNCLSSAPRTKTRDKIATRCSILCSEKDTLESVETLFKPLSVLVVYYVKRHTTRVCVKEKNSQNDMVLLDQRRRRLANVKQTLVRCLVLAKSQNFITGRGTM